MKGGVYHLPILPLREGMNRASTFTGPAGRKGVPEMRFASHKRRNVRRRSPSGHSLWQEHGIPVLFRDHCRYYAAFQKVDWASIREMPGKALRDPPS
jgi:hypothetical protein